MRCIRILLRRLLGDWWQPHYNGTSWGIYHPQRFHCWSHNMTELQAKRECDLRNYK